MKTIAQSCFIWKLSVINKICRSIIWECWYCYYVTDIYLSWKRIVHDATIAQSEMLIKSGAGVFISTAKHSHCKICCSTDKKKCQGQNEGLCLMEITLFEPWPEGFLVTFTWCTLWGQKALMVSSRHSWAQLHVFGGKISPEWHSSAMHFLFLYLTVHGFVALSARGHLHPCKDDFEINHLPTNTLNISWFYFTLFVLVFCDNQVVGKHLSIIHSCSIGSSELIGMVKWQGTW